jgi:hypothetical protein
VDDSDPMEEARRSPQSSPVIDFISDRPTITTVALFGFVIARVLIVARGDVPVALAIISAVGPISVVVNTIIASIDVMAFALFTILLTFLAPRLFERRWDNLLRVLLLVLVAVLVFVAPWPLLLVGLCLMPLRIAIYRRGLRGSSVTPDQARSLAVPPMASDLILPLVIILAYLLVAPVWLPAEAITLDSNKQTVGYVLNDQSDWYSLLTDKPRTVIRIEGTHVKARVVCLPKDQATFGKLTTARAVQRLLHHSTKLPEPLCPEL